jgi:4-amino-4-deoxy-L-arabinose transferase-like glycosyltransferase
LLFVGTHDILRAIMKNKLFIYFCLAIILLLGFILRYHNISPFKIYPDSYQSLLLANNISNYHSVVGFLGEQGTIYPQFFSWSRPGYAFLIIALNTLLSNTNLTAHFISFIAGLGSILLGYFVLKTIFKSYIYGLTGAFLLAISFNNTVWSGFIMTETLGVFTLLLFILQLTHSINHKTKLFFIQDLLTGLLFAFAVLTRYEYIVVIVPLIFFIFFCATRPLVRLLNIFLGFLVPIILVFFSLFPIHSTIAIIWKELPDQLVRLSLMLFILVITFLIPKFYWKKIAIPFTTYFPYGLLVLPLPFFFFNELLLLKKFFLLDCMISLFAWLGFFFLVKDKAYRKYGYFAFFSCFFLIIIYQNINNAMDRYITHTIPFLLIPAAYGLTKTIQIIRNQNKKIATISFVILFLVLFFQIFESYYGLRYMDDSWYKTSYEEKVAEQVKNYTNNKHMIFITSLPEPYFYNTKQSTHSIIDTYPFIFLPTDKPKTKILIIEDMALHNVFPNFTNFLHIFMKDKKQKQFFVHESFRLKNTKIKEDYPVIIYEVSLDELKKRIKKAHAYNVSP